MKPCGKNRKAIAWLAVGALDARQARELRAHLETCDGCRGYWNEISRVTETLAAAEANPRMEADSAFHQKLTRKLHAAESRSAGNMLSAFFDHMFTGLRIAIPLTAALAVVFLMMTKVQHQPTNSPSIPLAVVTAPHPQPVAEISPTMGNYEMAANESLDKLDELLTKQGSTVSTTTPVYTASMLKTPGATD